MPARVPVYLGPGLHYSVWEKLLWRVLVVSLQG